ncbi:uncharacterized protein LOC126902097 [Daktulosphaira vitifoliae]|uniref:uncharacterized protein LOC126902097 n=1 Tax=Daktulosphaira vitifoliae TaxID=58002 RepID=UPI0021AA9421|nr:uncharacterized protein LOC126902097 [Daktulosphaira vitifoliae]
MTTAIADFECILGSNNDYLIKELSVVDTDTYATQHWIFKHATPTDENSRNVNAWLKKHRHSICYPVDMFSSFLNLFNFKSDSDKVKSTGPLSRKTLNLNSPEAKALNIFNQKLPISRRNNGNNTPFIPNYNIAEVTSPGFSYRIAQRAREMRSTTPTSDISNLSVSYASENNSSNSNSSPHEFQNLGRENPNDKKRKLRKTLENFGVRNRTSQEFDFDNFVNCPKKAIESIDRNIPLNGIDKTNREISHSPYMTPKNNHVIFDRKQ